MQAGYVIRSKPEYAELAWHQYAQMHVLVAKGSGGEAVLRLLQQGRPALPLTVLYVRDADADYSEKLAAAAGASLQSFETEMDALFAFYRLLSAARMGTRIYLAGSESFIWAACKLAVLHDIQDCEIAREQCHSLARPVYCVHCKATTTEVTTNIVTCRSCMRKLFVRDHFSRHLGAYMGLMVDAETPGEIPAIEEMYS